MLLSLGQFSSMSQAWPTIDAGFWALNGVGISSLSLSCKGCMESWNLDVQLHLHLDWRNGSERAWLPLLEHQTHMKIAKGTELPTCAFGKAVFGSQIIFAMCEYRRNWYWE